ncbi:MAG: bifunctional 3,4-dihydroxy-2-butanone-4-phosphate synthase/GTP cyclohydrolase II [Chloroflexota bacterium]|nr:bifunctional 3,4-dihydroxy-2-butanone-4-phosphate synthase/GTP cyclohydrolase II [Chloroflexota bacterium]
MTLCSMEEAVSDLQAGKFIIVVDDENRENEGDLVLPAEKVTPEAVNFMVTHAKGLLCMPMTEERLDELQIPLVSTEHTPTALPTAFTVSIDYKKTTTTGISAFDRSATINALINPNCQPDDFARPGHLFPLRYHKGGVLMRPGHTEAIIDLCNIGGLYPAGVVCEIMKDDGDMARLPDLEEFAKKHDLKILSIAQLIAYRRRNETLIERVAEARLPSKYGEFKIVAYRSAVDPGEHIALTIGDWTDDDPVLSRIHSECLTGDVFGSLRCDCGEQMDLALQTLGQAGTGALLYMRQEGRGIGLHNKIKAYSLQDTGLDTIDANNQLGFDSDLRHYDIAAQMLLDLGIKKIRLLTNNPKKVVGLTGLGVEIVDRVEIEIPPNDENLHYLETKKSRMGHFLGSCS